MSEIFCHVPLTLPDIHFPHFNTFMAERKLPVSVAITSACRRKLIVVLHQIFAAVLCSAEDIGS
jgi:hypothetical protein